MPKKKWNKLKSDIRIEKEKAYRKQRQRDKRKAKHRIQSYKEHLCGCYDGPCYCFIPDDYPYSYWDETCY